MIAVDTNVLIFAHRGEATLHKPALAALEKLAESPSAWAIPMPCLHEFYATVTSTKCRPQSTPGQAWRMIDSLLDTANVRVIGEGVEHLRYLRQLTLESKVMGGMVHDAKIAAICKAHGVSELWTCDRDYSRFADLKTYNPCETGYVRKQH